MRPWATKFNAFLSFNDFKTNYEWSEGLDTPRPREIDLSTNSYTNYFACEPSMGRNGNGLICEDSTDLVQSDPGP